MNRTIVCAVTVVSLLIASAPASAQSLLERTPNLSAGWIGTDGTGYFNFMHRFHKSGGKVTNWPGFLLGYSFADMFLAGLHYTSFSRLAQGEFNEFEPFLRFAPLQSTEGLPLTLSVTAAYNSVGESVDGELAVAVPVGPATLHGTLRGFSKAFEARDARVAVGGGATLKLSERIALAGDLVTPVSKREGEAYGWGAALQLAIPSTPHTLSLQAANTNSSSLQGSSLRTPLGRKGTRWGFEFTVPITFSRYFGGGGGQDLTVTADTVRVPIRDFEFAIQRLTVRAGTTVVWVNEGNVAHTSTSDTQLWSSPLLARGESYSRVFSQPGEFPYFCAPHTFMRAVIVVQ